MVWPWWGIKNKQERIRHFDWTDSDILGRWDPDCALTDVNRFGINLVVYNHVIFLFEYKIQFLF